MITKQEEKLIKRQGYAPTGGIPRKLYWTPDGREVRAIASEREFIKKDDEGTVIDSGIRDANLDKGWLTQPPQNPVPYCSGCDKWHDTDEEVTLCIAEKQKQAEKWEAWARKENEGEATLQAKEMEEMSNQILELKGMIYELVNKGNGHQRES